MKRYMLELAIMGYRKAANRGSGFTIEAKRLLNFYNKIRNAKQDLNLPFKNEFIAQLPHRFQNYSLDCLIPY